MKDTSCGFCPLCRRSLDDRTQPPSVPTVPRVDSLWEAVREALQDIDAWASGDACADDGEFLWLSDLTVYLAKLLARPLMRMYRANLVRYRAEFGKAKTHVREQLVRRRIKLDAISDVSEVTAREMKRTERTQAPPSPKTPKECCVNGHRRTPENTRANGACIQCGRERSARTYAEHKAGGASVEKSKVAGDDNASA